MRASFARGFLVGAIVAMAYCILTLPGCVRGATIRTDWLTYSRTDCCPAKADAPAPAPEDPSTDAETEAAP